MINIIKQDVSSILQNDVQEITYHASGQIGAVYKVRTAEGTCLVKSSEENTKLQIEAKMLTDLQEAGLRTPNVIAVSRNYLALEWIESVNLSRNRQEIDAAQQLAALHRVSNAERMYGYYYDTTIGPFPQHNEQTQYNWTLFLGEMRIQPMAQYCFDTGRLSKALLKKIETLCSRLHNFMDMAGITSSLLHGDVWSGNVLFDQKGACFIDPAIYFGDREMELAFILLFNTFGEIFFNRYQEEHTLSPEFYETKVPLYQIYPLLVHVALYGDAYLGSLERIVKRFE
ncbi:MAG: fructosamine kinase family protein [Campylobacterota bacterium]|nr:fructosamine kinase family protein [Campylobacterota bacterium]